MNRQSAKAIIETQEVVMDALSRLENFLLKEDPEEFDRFTRLYGKASKIIWNNGMTLSAPIEEARNELA